MKVLILGDIAYNKPWHVTYPGVQVDNVYSYKGPKFGLDVAKYDAVQFTGGSDVTPALYGEENTHSGNDVNRDIYECHIFRAARAKLIPCVGICRGSQFLRVMCGGTLIQDIDGHLGNHLAQYVGGGEIEVTSTHHQQAVPDPVRFRDVLSADSGAVVEGWASRYHIGVNAVQYHPEYMDLDSDGFKFYQDIIRDAMGEPVKRWEILQ